MTLKIYSRCTACNKIVDWSNGKIKHRQNFLSKLNFNVKFSHPRYSRKFWSNVVLFLSFSNESIYLLTSLFIYLFQEKLGNCTQTNRSSIWWFGILVIWYGAQVGAIHSSSSLCTSTVLGYIGCSINIAVRCSTVFSSGTVLISYPPQTLMYVA